MTAQPQDAALTVIQEQLWHLDARVAAAALNLSYALLIEGPLNVVALRDALTDVIAAQSSLRTVYPERGGVPVVVLCDAAPFELTVVPVADLAEAGDLMWRERESSFDLARAVPIRVMLLALDTCTHVLLVTLHHIAADGWSMQLLSVALSKAYRCRLSGTAPDLGRDAADCLAVAAAQQDWLHSDAATAERDWWIEHLADATPRWASTPVDHRPAVDLVRCVRTIPKPVVAELRSLARSGNVSMYALLLTAFGVVLGQRSPGQLRPVIGTLVANRPSLAASQALGAHYNGLLLDVDLTGDPSLAECLFRTASRTVSALDHQRLPFARVLAGLRHELGWKTGIPHATFLMDRYPMESLALAGCTVTGMYLEHDGRIPAATASDLTFFVRETRDHLTVTAFGVPDLLGAAELAEFTSTYLGTLTALCESVETPIAELESWIEEADPPGDHDPPRPPALHKIIDISPADALSPMGHPSGVMT